MVYIVTNLLERINKNVSWHISISLEKAQRCDFGTHTSGHKPVNQSTVMEVGLTGVSNFKQSAKSGSLTRAPEQFKTYREVSKCAGL